MVRFSNNYVRRGLVACFLFLIQDGRNANGAPVASSLDPFIPNVAPPPHYGPPSPNYAPQAIFAPPPNFGPPPNYGPPLNFYPPPNFGSPTNFKHPPPNFGPPPNYGPPLQNYGHHQNPNSNIGTFNPQLPFIPPPAPIRAAPTTADLNQPMPQEAQNAGSGYASSHGAVEQEFEGNGHAGGGLDPSYLSNQPSTSLGATDIHYGPQDKPLLDAYYDRNPGSRSSNDVFGGMFGGTLGGNLAGAYMINEYVF